MKLKLVSKDDPAIHSVSLHVAPEEMQALRDTYPALLVFMTRNNAVGLAANQIGDLRRWFVWQNGMVINPVVNDVSPIEEERKEGCLTYPGLTKMVKRPEWIVVTYTDERGITLTNRTFTGMTARVFLHELDHLNGKTIAD